MQLQKIKILPVPKIILQLFNERDKAVWVPVPTSSRVPVPVPVTKLKGTQTRDFHHMVSS